MKYVYVLKSEEDGSFYIGSTKDIEKRMLYHNRGYNLSTKNKRPWLLIRAEEYVDDRLVLKREKFLKSGKGRQVIKNLCGL